MDDVAPFASVTVSAAEAAEAVALLHAASYEESRGLENLRHSFELRGLRSNALPATPLT